VLPTFASSYRFSLTAGIHSASANVWFFFIQICAVGEEVLDSCHLVRNFTMHREHMEISLPLLRKEGRTVTIHFLFHVTWWVPCVKRHKVWIQFHAGSFVHCQSPLSEPIWISALALTTPNTIAPLGLPYVVSSGFVVWTSDSSASWMKTASLVSWIGIYFSTQNEQTGDSGYYHIYLYSGEQRPLFHLNLYYKSPWFPIWLEYQHIHILLNVLYTNTRYTVPWGTILQAERSWFQFPMSLDFSSDLNPSSQITTQRSTQPLTEMGTRNLPGVKGRPAPKADNVTPTCELTVLKMWEPRRLTTLWAFMACYRDIFKSWKF
jgi:hypothetical protein